MTVPEPTVQATAYAVNCLPESPDFPDGRSFGITVEYRGDGRWGVFRSPHCCLGADGAWSWGFSGPDGDREPVTDAEREAYRRGREEWLDAHRFDEETALKLAREAAPHVTVNGITVQQALDWRSKR